MNEATLEEVPFGQQPPPLELRTVRAGENVIDIVGEADQRGQALAFDGQAWVEGVGTRVLGFRAH